jgi:hypothetical protein
MNAHVARFECEVAHTPCRKSGRTTTAEGVQHQLNDGRCARITATPVVVWGSAVADRRPSPRRRPAIAPGGSKGRRVTVGKGVVRATLEAIAKHGFYLTHKAIDAELGVSAVVRRRRGGEDPPGTVISMKKDWRRIFALE